jgi:hypothetical protein
MPQNTYYKTRILSQSSPLRQSRNHILDSRNLLLKNTDDLSPHCLLQGFAFIARDVLASSIVFVSAPLFLFWKVNSQPVISICRPPPSL